MSPRRLGLVLAALVAVGLGAQASPAGAAQYQAGAAYTYWNVGDRQFTKFTQTITINQRANDTFWNSYWHFFYGPHGYLGIQTPGGTNNVHFSMWGATVASAGTGATCTTFNEAGPLPEYSYGKQCQLPIVNPLSKNVTLELSKVLPSDGNDLRWRAYATIDGVKKTVGTITSPRAGHLNDVMNFQEYFGQGNGWNGSYCVQPGPPSSSAVYGRPTVSSPTLAATALTRASGSANKCPGAAWFSNPFYDAAAMKLGDV